VTGIENIMNGLNLMEISHELLQHENAERLATLLEAQAP
jgi:hypothetical protein